MWVDFCFKTLCPFSPGYFSCWSPKMSSFAVKHFNLTLTFYHATSNHIEDQTIKINTVGLLILNMIAFSLQHKYHSTNIILVSTFSWFVLLYYFGEFGCQLNLFWQPVLGSLYPIVFNLLIVCILKNSCMLKTGLQGQSVFW